jgi:hypothetical protein
MIGYGEQITNANGTMLRTALTNRFEGDRAVATEALAIARHSAREIKGLGKFLAAGLEPS